MANVADRYTGEGALLPAVAAANEARVRRGFWSKLRRVAARIPFAHDLAAAYFCAVDPRTPFRVRATLMGALAYFVLPIDVIPDFLAVVGLTDDAAVLASALGLFAGHIRPRHRAAAEAALAAMREAD